jgi:hypothetical protein
MSTQNTKLIFISFISAFAIVLLGSGCNSSPGLTSQITAAEAQASTPPTGVAVVSATTAQCSNGGSVIETFSDINGNGTLDTGEKVLTQSVVCDGTNGTNGSQGNGAGIIIAQAAAGACPAGGETLTTFVDTNNNGTLDAGESVTSISTLCNGTNGTNGDSAHITVTPASSAQCADGGAVYTSYLDGQTPVVTPICNGTNGTNGATGASGTQLEMGALGPAVPNQPFSACHHDYMYIPGTASANGWLVFRHQDNGNADQGIGSTGFQVWNVDISDFLLVSEVGSVTYCQCHWDPVTKLLAYTVDDADDGFQGLTGSIQF